MLPPTRDQIVSVILVILPLSLCLPTKVNEPEVISVLENEPWNGKEYKFRFITSLGNIRSERGFLKQIGKGIEALNVEGEYTYPLEGGVLRKVIYQANEGGYKVLSTVDSTAVPQLRISGDSATSISRPSDTTVLHDTKVNATVIPTRVHEENDGIVTYNTDDLDDRFGLSPNQFATMLGR